MNHLAKKQAIINNQKNIANLLDRIKPQIQAALPKHLTADRMCRIAMVEIRRNSRLAECDPASFAGAVMIASGLGLEIGALGHAYLIPHYNKAKKLLECTFILGYKGMIDLARRSGQIESIYAQCVYENDEFEYEYGLQEKLKHVPALGERGELKMVYALAKLKGGGYQFEVLSKHDVDFYRSRSKSSQAGPWVTDYTEMARKTAIRRLFKYLPISIEMQRAISIEEKLEVGEGNTFDMIKEDFDLPDDLGADEDKEPLNLADGSVKNISATYTAAATTTMSQADKLASKL